MHKPWHDEARKLLQEGMNAAQIARRLGQRYMTVYMFCKPEQRARHNAHLRSKYAENPAYREYKKAQKRRQSTSRKGRFDFAR